MSTTRYYFDGATPPVSPAYSGTWGLGNSVRGTLQTATPTANVTTMSQNENVSTAVWVRLGQFVGPATLTARTLTGTAVAMMHKSYTSFGTSSNATARIIVRVVSGDGTTVRGTLVTLSGTSLIQNSTNRNNKLLPSTALTPVVAQAGDRLVVEVGHYANNTSGTADTHVSTLTADATLPTDLAATDATTTDARSWLDLVLDDPPNVPTGLVQTAASTTTFRVDWTPPAAGTTPTGYDVRLDGGAVTAVGLVTHIDVTGLAPDTDYLLEVRSTAASGTSAWVGITASTDPLPIPGPPTDLVQTGLTTSSVDVEWTAPVGGTAPTGYDYRLDGGAVTAAGLVTTLTIPALAPATTYLLEVRSTGASGASAWVSLEVTTATEATLGGLRLEVGPEEAAIDLLGPTYTITARRGNSTRGVTDTLEAGTLVAVIDGPSANPLTVPEVRTGALVRVLAGIDRGLGDGLEWDAIWTGKLDRARLVYTGGAGKADPDAYRVTLTATDHAPLLAGTPVETAVGGTLAQRVAHVLDPTGLPYDVTDPAPILGAPPALGTSERTAAGGLRLAVDTAHALAYLDRNNVIQVLSDAARPRIGATDAADLTATDDPASSAEALHYYALSPTLDTAAIVNVLDVELVAGDGTTTTTTHVDTDSRDEHGPHADKVTVNDGLPETHADLWLASRRDPELRPESLSINVLRRPSHLAAAIDVEPYTTMAVERAGVLPAPVTVAVRDVEHNISADRRNGIRWLCHLGLRPLEVLATRWDDVPPGIRWDDLDPTMTWDDVVRWHPYA